MSTQKPLHMIAITPDCDAFAFLLPGLRSDNADVKVLLQNGIDKLAQALTPESSADILIAVRSYDICDWELSDIQGIALAPTPVPRPAAMAQTLNETLCLLPDESPPSIPGNNARIFTNKQDARWMVERFFHLHFPNGIGEVSFAPYNSHPKTITLDASVMTQTPPEGARLKPA